MKKFKLALAMASSVLLIALTCGVFSQPAYAAPKDAVCVGAGLVGGSGDCTVPGDQPSVDTTLQRGVKLFSAVVGLIAVIMFIVGGLKYMTSQGDPGQTNSAKNTLIYAAVGLVVVALAQVFTNFVLERFTK